jgi:enoyl-CoA hydratase/carnithine racemase
VIEVRRDGDVRVVTLSAPDRRNALTPDGLDRLATAVDDAETPVVYCHGAGAAFCAGADFSVVDDLSPARARRFARNGQRVARTVSEADAVVIAGVDGAARGGGVELALACDLRVATPDATFAETGVSIGLFGAWGGTVRLREALAAADAFDLALTGRTVDAEDALRMGLVSRVTEDPRSVADSVAANDHRAVAVLKRRLRDDAPARTRERREARAFGDLVEHRNETDADSG